MDDEDEIDRQIRELQERKARFQREAADAKRDLENAKKKKEAERARKLATLAALQQDISGLAASVVASETGIRRIIDVDGSSSSDNDDMSVLTKADDEEKKSVTVSSVTSTRHEKDGKKSIKDADGRSYRVYNKLVAAEAVRYNLHAMRLTDPKRVNVLFGEEQVQMVPSVWLEVLKKK
jgi:seryl-tRNA synthetase